MHGHMNIKKLTNFCSKSDNSLPFCANTQLLSETCIWYTLSILVSNYCLRPGYFIRLLWWVLIAVSDLATGDTEYGRAKSLFETWPLSTFLMLVSNNCSQFLC